MDPHEKSAAGSLDGIRRGAGNLLLVCKTTLRDLENALDEGRFIDGFRIVGGLSTKVEALCDAEAALGTLADASIVKVEDVEKGMVVQSFGEVTEISACPHCNGERCQGKVLTFEIGAMLFPPGQEVLVQREG